MRRASPPSLFTAVRMDARSTTAGTPVKSCRMTRAGMKGSSTSAGRAAFQAARRRTSASVTSSPSRLRRTDSSSTLIEKGRRSRSPVRPLALECAQTVVGDRPLAGIEVSRAPK